MPDTHGNLERRDIRAATLPLKPTVELLRSVAGPPGPAFLFV